MLDPPAAAPEPAPRTPPVSGRACGSCTLCCKVYDIAELDKKAGAWCGHCEPGRGCRIHESRPRPCRDFDCLWLTQSWLGPEWKPDRARMVLSVDSGTRFLFVQVDPGAATAWRGAPYYGALKQWAAAAVSERRHVVVFLNKSATVILPDRDVPLGPLGPGDRIVARERRTGEGVTFDVERIAA